MQHAEPPAGAAPGVTPRSSRAIFLFWVPLAAQWLMMASEGPFLAAIIARLGDPTFNLAAYGVSFAVAILVESPVIMLMSASTALVEDRESYVKLRNFTRALNAGSTLLLLLLLIPPVFGFFAGTLLGLPEGVAELVYGSLWILLPWPAAIGYRRFLHGLLIRAGRTRLVAYGTVLRIVGMAGTATALYLLTELPGAWVGAAALSAGVCVEAATAHVMALPVIRRLQHGAELAPPEEGPRKVAAPPPERLNYREIARFYYPLALTSFIGLTVQPVLTFFMGRAPSPVESLAVFPVVHALSFLFRALGLSYQEAAIALLGKRAEHQPEVARFGMWLGLASAGGLGLVAFTPLADVWFITVSGLTPELAELAIVATRVIVIFPALTVLLSYQRSILVIARRTAPVTMASALEVGTIALLFPLFGFLLGWVGVVAAVASFMAGRLVGTAYLLPKVRRALRGLG
ncbi:MAG: hypothetical protein WEB88_09190 [Gemmatimonadota bacterium]